MTPGTCQYCRCTEAQACEGGCAWSDETRTCCSVCEWAEAVAGVFVTAHDRIRGTGDLPWASRRHQERQAYVIATRLVLEKLQSSYEASLSDGDADAATELQRLVIALADRHPEPVARALHDGTSVVDLVLELLGERRIIRLTP